MENEELQQMVMEYQQIQQQLAMIGNQKYQLELVEKEIEAALEELEKIDDGAPVYKSIGSLLMKVNDQKELVNDLTDQKETTKIRVEAMDRQESVLKERFAEIQKSLSSGMPEQAQAE